MQEATRREIVSALSASLARADKLKQELDTLVEQHQLYQDKSGLATVCVQVVNEAYKFVRHLREANDALKRAGAEHIKSYVTGWYRDLHFDMDPLVEIAEEDITDPDFESITYDGDDQWTVIMTTKTHGRERIVVYSDTASWDEIYAADRIN
jgi:hypothetical protein